MRKTINVLAEARLRLIQALMMKQGMKRAGLIIAVLVVKRLMRIIVVVVGVECDGCKFWYCSACLPDHAQIRKRLKWLWPSF